MQKYGIVNSRLLNLRNGPNTSSPILAQLPQGTILNILADAGYDWLQVQMDGQPITGYVSKVYLTLTDTKPSAPGDSPVVAPVVPPPTAPPVVPTPPAPAGSRAEVITQTLNVRSGPSTTFDILSMVHQGAVLEVLGIHDGWVKVLIGTAEGYVAAQFVNLNTTQPLNGFLIERPELVSADLVPAQLIPAQTPQSDEALVARIWNNEGGLLGKVATLLNIPVGGVVAVLAVESGGNAFAPDGRVIIRFEVHIFYRYWGKDHPQDFSQFFTFDANNPASGHAWRSKPDAPWQSFHGNQDLEWQVLTFARSLDDTAAFMSISMGAPQIMGFNHRSIGYESVQDMYNAFANSIQKQLLALFDFVKGAGATAPAIQALQNRDYLTFATIYNGPGNPHSYSDLIQKDSALYDTLMGSATTSDGLPG